MHTIEFLSLPQRDESVFRCSAWNWNSILEPPLRNFASVMEEPEFVGEEEEKPQGTEAGSIEKPCSLENLCRKEKRKALKKIKRKQLRKEEALKKLQEEEAQLNDPEEQRRIRLMELEEEERSERERKLFEERERAWLEAMELKKKKMAEEEEEEEQRRRALEEESTARQVFLSLLVIL